jgi:hypothetical protein
MLKASCCYYSRADTAVCITLLLIRCIFCLYCDEQVAPSYENIELGIGEQVVMKVIAEATGRLMKNVSI